jgi:transcriptional regulator
VPKNKDSEYRDLFPGALEMMILQSLRVRPMHGYALAKHIKSSSDDLLQIEEGSLYPALQRMLKEGWLESKPGISAQNRPVRIFKLTKAGAKHLQQEISSFEKMFNGIARVLAIAES